ncbi:hypothetical protein STHU_03000 [Allostella humosa]|nr:hypothetical protein STHU_03000 [Stella humosa]
MAAWENKVIGLVVRHLAGSQLLPVACAKPKGAAGLALCELARAARLRPFKIFAAG